MLLESEVPQYENNVQVDSYVVREKFCTTFFLVTIT